MSRQALRGQLMGASHAASSPSEKSGLRALTALIVDDNLHMRKLLRALLVAFGIRDVFEAADGLSGVEVLKEVKPDFVLADYDMKPVNGIGFVKMVRRTCAQPLAFVPIIMITGHTELRLIRMARDSGINEILCKPITPRDLYERIVEIIERPRGFIMAPEFVGPDRRRRRNAQYEGPKRRAEDQGLEVTYLPV